MFLLSRAGLRYNEKAIGLGAQTERRGVAGPVRDLLGGETSPAVCFRLRFGLESLVKQSETNHYGFSFGAIL